MFAFGTHGLSGDSVRIHIQPIRRALPTSRRGGIRPVYSCVRLRRDGIKKASLDCCLASRRTWASDGIAPGGSGCKQPALARPSASSLPGMLVCPGIQRTCTFSCELASSWNLVNLSCDESARLPRRQLATARLSVQTTTLLVVSPRRRAAWRPSRAPVASASKTSDGPRSLDQRLLIPVYCKAESHGARG